MFNFKSVGFITNLTDVNVDSMSNLDFSKSVNYSVLGTVKEVLGYVVPQPLVPQKVRRLQMSKWIRSC